MQQQTVPVIFAGPDDTHNAVLPLDFGTLGGDVMFVQRISDNGSPSVANVSYNNNNGSWGRKVSNGNELYNANSNDYTGMLFMAWIRTPASPFPGE